MNKRGIVSFEMIMWAIVRVVFLIAAVTSIIILTNQFIITNIDVDNTESEIFKNRLLYTLSYVDENKVTHIGIIDVNKLNTAWLEENIVFADSRTIAANLTLDGKEVLFNELWYARWREVVGFKESSGAKEFKDTRTVLFNENNQLKKGELEISILMPND